MVELGKHAAEVLSAYAISIVLIGGLVAQSFLRSARVRRALDEVEARRRPDGD